MSLSAHSNQPPEEEGGEVLFRILIGREQHAEMVFMATKSWQRALYAIAVRGARASLRVLLIISERQEKYRLPEDQARRQRPLGFLSSTLFCIFGRASEK